MQKGVILCESVNMHQTDNGVDAAADVLVEHTQNNVAILKLSPLQEQDDTDVMKQLVISLGNATYSGSKATSLALKMEAVTAKEVGIAIDSACIKTNQGDFEGDSTFKETTQASLDSFVDITKVFLDQAVMPIKRQGKVLKMTPMISFLLLIQFLL